MAESSSTELETIARDLSLPLEQVQAVARLLDEGNTPAFITRFRREASGGLNEGRILDIKRRLALQRSLAERKSIILKSIESQGKLTEELAAAIRRAPSSKQLEDLYLPHKPQKQSLGQIARQRGLDPLAADIFLGQAGEDLATRATDYVRVDRGLHTLDDVFKGVGHLIAERFADDVQLRSKLRDILWKTGRIATRKIESQEPPATPPAGTPAESTSASSTSPSSAEDAATTTEAGDSSAAGETNSNPSPSAAVDSAESAVAPEQDVPPASESPAAMDGEPREDLAPEPAGSEAPSPTIVPGPNDPTAKKAKRRPKKKAASFDPFKEYADFSERITKLPPYRTLAINRAERSKGIRVRIRVDDSALDEITKSLVPEDHAFREFIEKCASDAIQRLIIPSLEREVRRELTEGAEQHALKVFGRNLRHLLLKPPVRNRRVLAIDPGFRYGCHAAALDEFGRPLGHAVLQVVGNEQRRAEGRQKLSELIQAHQPQVIAIGNGSACRETEQLVSDLINSDLAGRNLEYVIVNEAGTNAYATSEIGREELPQCEPAVRSAVSIGRRLLDPLSELVKVDPAHLGIGLYQHDIKGRHLAHELDEVVASCVNYVGVDVNTASPALLAHVSGLGPLAARRIYEYRVQHGPFRNRQQLKQVAGIGEQTFVQAAGFLRTTEGDHPLDSTMIHPESYELATKILNKAGFQPGDLVQRPVVKDVAAPPVEGTDPAPPAVETPAAADDSELFRRRGQIRDALYKLDRHQLAQEFSVSPLVIGDIIHVLLQTGIDPRERLPGAVFRKGIIKLEDLEPSMQLRAQVVNVVDFGVFVDIGLGESSLIHISRLADGFVSDPHLMFAVGDTLDVWVTQIDTSRRRVTLTAVPPGGDKRASGTTRRERPHGKPSGGGDRSPRAPRGRKPFPQRPKRVDSPKRVQKPPRPVTPITPEMVEGKAPMRSFSDLAQFFTQRQTPPKDN